MRVEVGPRDLANGEVTLVRRDTGTKVQVPLAGAAAAVTAALEAAQADLYAGALERRDAATAEVTTLAEAHEAALTGFAKLPWAAVGESGEAELAQSGITVRCLQRADGTLPRADDEADLVALVARSY